MKKTAEKVSRVAEGITAQQQSTDMPARMGQEAMVDPTQGICGCQGVDLKDEICRWSTGRRSLMTREGHRAFVADGKTTRGWMEDGQQQMELGCQNGD